MYRNTYSDTKVVGFENYAGRVYDGSTIQEGKDVEFFQEIRGSSVIVDAGPETTHVNHPVPEEHIPTKFRASLFGFAPRPAQKSGLRGYFFIGTYENRPAIRHVGNGTITPLQVAGNAQEDGPQGTLTSDPFEILGTKISFLVGGGCDPNKVYVELLVDGAPVKKATGECKETMRRVIWDVGSYKWQSARIRIVDASSANWAHINFDDVRFNWDESYRSRSTTPSADGTNRGAPARGASGYGGEPEAGSVYAFRRRAGGEGNVHPCEIECDPFSCFFVNNPPKRWNCEWEFQQKLLPSDRRAGDRFGFSLDIDDQTGTAVVGAYGSRGVNHFNHDEMGGRSQVGATYVFKRIEEQRSGSGILLSAPRWLVTEHFKVQHGASKVMQDRLGYSVSISGYKALLGGPHMTPVATSPEAGSSFIVNVETQMVRFKSLEYVVTENFKESDELQNPIRIVLQRYGNFDSTISVAYHTLDVTAIGMSEQRTSFCQSMKSHTRGQNGCGDYTQASGIVTFYPNEFERTITLYTINDNCHEKYAEYFRVVLSVPGGDVLIGNDYVTTVRIDDDDPRGNEGSCTSTRALSTEMPWFAEDEQPITRGTPSHEEPVPLTETQRFVLTYL